VAHRVEIMVMLEKAPVAGCVGHGVRKRVERRRGHLPSLFTFLVCQGVLLLVEDDDSIGRLVKQYLEQQDGWRVGNLDCIVIAEQPRIAPYVEAIRRSVAELLGTDPARVSVKGKTTERLGFIGRGEAIAASAVVLLIGG